LTDIGRKISPAILSDIPPDFDPRLVKILESLREAIDLREGRIAPGKNARFVTIQDLVDANVIADGDIT
jgi:hypothetical protein